MTSAGFQPIYRKNINIAWFDGTRINPQDLAQRITSLFIHNIHFCLIWKSNGIRFNQEVKDELKPNFKVVDDVISDKHVESFIQNDYKPKS